MQTAIAAGMITAEPGANTDDSSSGHGTHTAASVVGDGSDWSTVPETPPGSGSVSENRWRGVQPEAALHHISFANDYGDRETFERLVEEGAHISTNSWGYCTLVGCNPVTSYDAAAAAWDEGVWDADDDVPGQQPLIVFFSAGNDGNGGFDGCGTAGANTISTPATAKNIITIGANETDRGCNVLEDNVGDVATFSSRGPVAPDGTGQGLFKPEITATGTRVLSAESDGTGGRNADARNGPFSCSDSGTSYAYKDGTSMSCPHGAGIGGVLLQDLIVKRGVAAPSPALVKALLINGARALQPGGSCKYGFDTRASEIHQGWGQAQAPDSMYGRGGSPSERSVGFENEFAKRSVATGESRVASLQVQAGGDLRVTLAWTDYPASPIATSPLVVNDLDLEVSGPEGTFIGNNFSGDWSLDDTISATADRYNVVENVYIANVQGGTYQITVRGHQVSQDMEPEAAGVEQPYALVWSAPGPPPMCSDGIDNDGDNKIDWDGGAAAGLSATEQREPDRDCANKPWKNKEATTGCGLGFELALILAAFGGFRARRKSSPGALLTPAR
ncbi:MAG TPA: S8 family serine peptidase [Phycisphaerae bacterium]|nr:S8 family serine peptidase [Phycisphaerae bacterium]